MKLIILFILAYLLFSTEMTDITKLDYKLHYKYDNQNLSIWDSMVVEYKHGDTLKIDTFNTITALTKNIKNRGWVISDTLIKNEKSHLSSFKTRHKKSHQDYLFKEYKDNLLSNFKSDSLLYFLSTSINDLKILEVENKFLNLETKEYNTYETIVPPGGHLPIHEEALQLINYYN